MKYTAGPWRFDGAARISAPFGRAIADIATHSNIPDGWLIAAAPDMYELIKRFANDLNDTSVGWECQKLLRRIESEAGAE